MSEESFKGPANSKGFYRIPIELVDDLTFQASGLRLYAIIMDRTTEEQEVRNSELSKATGLTKTYVIELKSQIADRGFLKRAFDQHGQPYYSAIFNLDDVRKRTDLFLSVSTFFKSILNTKNFFLIKTKTDPELFFLALEMLEWSNPDNVKNPYGLLKFYIKGIENKTITPKKGFIRGWWMDRIKEKEARKQAAKATTRTERDHAQGRERDKAFDKHYDSLSKAQIEVQEKQALERLKANGGVPDEKLGRRIAIKLEMKKIWEEGLKHEDHRGHRNQGKEA